MYFQGRRVMESCDSIQGSQPLSRYGDRRVTILPSVFPVIPLQRSCGLHRFEPVILDGITPATGNVTYPTRNFATLGPFNVVAPTKHFLVRTWAFLPGSACRHAVRTISSQS